MNADLYVQILEECLLPFLQEIYPDSHCFMQDNDPKHTSRWAQQFFTQNNVNWWKTPPESPDANPIENLWHELKVQIYHCMHTYYKTMQEFVRREVKPTNKDELIQGILQFGATVNVSKCRRYIGHLRKVLPKIFELNGDATGY